MTLTTNLRRCSSAWIWNLALLWACSSGGVRTDSDRVAATSNAGNASASDSGNTGSLSRGGALAVGGGFASATVATSGAAAVGSSTNGGTLSITASTGTAGRNGANATGGVNVGGSTSTPSATGSAGATRNSSGGTRAMGGASNSSASGGKGIGGATSGGASSSGRSGSSNGNASAGASKGGASSNTGGSNHLAGSGPCGDGADMAVPDGYRLVWSDEFATEGAPNPANWGFELGFVRNEEDQWYQPDNASVEGGCLVIEARRERKANPNYKAGSSDWKTNRQYAEYTSSSLRTMGKQSWRYGRFEMRGRIKTQAGLWPAWWTLGVEKEWPSCGEIDIMEFYAGSVRANIACGTATRWEAKWDGAAWQVASFEDKNWQDSFHVWRMDWDETKIDLLLDDKLVNTAKLTDMLNSDGTSPFKQAHYMIVNLAIGGNNGGDPSKTTFPSRYEVDYVRVFQKQ